MYPPVPVPSEGPQIPANLPQSAGMSTPHVVARASRRDPGPDPDQSLLRIAHERFHRCRDYESRWRRSAQQELDFLALEHWSEDQKQERLGRPCLVFDRIGPSIDQIINNARQSPPEPKVSPVGGGADKKTAEILQGLLRNIDNDSRADIAYMTGYKHACQIGRGWWRVLTEWEDDADDISLQKIVVKALPNPFSVYPDPSAQQFDFSDMAYCFVTEDIDVELYRELYGDSNVAGLADFDGIADPIRLEWFPQGAVRVAEYWWVERENYKIVQWRDPVTGQSKVGRLEEVPEGAMVTASRRREGRKIHCVKMNGSEILDRWEWPGKWIPIIPCIGEEIIKDGKRSLRGLVRKAMDANLSYDYMRSKEAEAIGLAPISQWLVAEGQIENHEAQWADANRKAFAYLVYKSTGTRDEPVPPPIRINAEPAVQAITNAIVHADNDIKATLSMYDANLGSPGPEQSGKAILARQREGDNAHFNYHDNLGWSMRHTARVMVDLIPHIYSEARALQIYDPDGSIREVQVNQPFIEKGEQVIYKLGPGAGRYDVIMGSGGSFASRLEQAQNALLQLVPVVPALQARAADLIIKALNIPGGDEIADRVRPPDIQVEQDGQQAPIPPQAQAQMAQQGQMVQLLTQELNKMKDLIQNKVIDNESKERIAAMNNQTQLAIADLKAGTDHSIELMQEQFAAITNELQAMRAAQAQEQQSGATQTPPPTGPEGPSSPAASAPGPEPAAPGSAEPIPGIPGQ